MKIKFDCFFSDFKKGICFILVGFVFFSNSLANAGGVFGPQSSSANVDWGFDFVETFDGLQDWKGTVCNGASYSWQKPDDFPKHLDGAKSNWERYAAYKKGQCGGDWIKDHGIHSNGTNNVWRNSGKSLLMSLDGRTPTPGPGDFGLYFGDGTPESGYDEIYLFHMTKISKNQFPTFIDPVTTEGTYTEGEPYQYFFSWKFSVFNIGRNNVGIYDNRETSYSPYHIIPHPIVPGRSNPIKLQIGIKNPGGTDPQAYVWTSGKAVQDFFPDWWGVEYHFKNENNVTTMNVWVYDKNGNSWQVLTDYRFTYTSQPSTHKWNEWFLGVNNSHSYNWGPTMDALYYVDDIIINGSRIGPRYFEIIKKPIVKDTTPPGMPTGLRLK